MRKSTRPVVYEAPRAELHLPLFENESDDVEEEERVEGKEPYTPLIDCKIDFYV